MDQTEKELSITFYKAHINLLLYLKPRLEKNFQDFLGDKVWNPESFAYRLFHNHDINKNKNSSSSRRKLALIVHPDKCKDPDANLLFQKIETLTDPEVELALNSENPLLFLKNQSINQSELESLKKECYILSNSIWYLYHTSPSIFKDAFCTKEEQEKRKEELEKRARELCEENKLLEERLRKLNMP